MTAIQFGHGVGIGPIVCAQNGNAARARSGVFDVESILQTHLTLNSGNANIGFLKPALPEREWLNEAIETGRRKRFTADMLVTGPMAAEMLLHNIGNRPLTAARVIEHKGRLLAGTFILTHQGIAFAADGTLNDGQHRLTAIAETGVSGVIQVTFGADRAEFTVIDQGGSRTVADLLSISDIPNYAIYASTSALIYILQNGWSVPKPQELTRFALSIYNKDKAGDLAAACRQASSLHKLTNPSTIALAQYWIISNSTSPADTRLLIEQFWTGMAKGELLTGVRLRLRNWLLSDENKFAGNGRQLSMRRAVIIIRAWNAWRKGLKSLNTDVPASAGLPKAEQ